MLLQMQVCLNSLTIETREMCKVHFVNLSHLASQLSSRQSRFMTQRVLLMILFRNGIRDILGG